MNEELEITLKGVEFKHLQDQIYEKVRGKYSLKRIEVEVLYVLSREKKCNTPTEVSKKFKLNRGHVSQAIDVLSKRELIRSLPDKEDRRSTHYYPTEAAQEVISEIEDSRAAVFACALKGISEKDIQTYLAVSSKILENIKNATVNVQ